jgi:prepilin-type processing-associated H-X9-DG protein
MRAGPNVYDNADRLFPNHPGLTAGHIAQSRNWEFVPPAGYLPKMLSFKRPTLKVFLADGLRFYGGENTIDYNTDVAAAKGAMSGEPPSTYTPDNPEWCREYVLAKYYSYRHGNHDRINALFMDGHVEQLFATTRSEGPFTGSAVNPKYYYPSGTLVKDEAAGRLHMTIPGGTILP